MTTDDSHREQAAAGLEQLASLVRAQSWRPDGTPSLPPTQAAVLRMLAGTATPLRAREIAQRLGVTAASLSDSLKALESKAWIEREPDPDDRRAATVRLTRSGRATVRQLRHPSRGMGSLLQGLDEGDIGALLRVTQLMVRQAQRQGLATGARTCLGCRYFQPDSTGDARRPHFCGFVQQPFGDPELRADCDDQSPADETQIEANALRFRRPVPP
ncbi:MULTISPECIES: MarR family transcriptional regulator [unclassified Lysobacter]|uniref:MarR family winged helix-turn-helix transcriptional regulator n=1 Tax=unclassified Lysobacter TaxID=2635362 RepID=UPI001C227B0D|nr:MarR family transcriptional regulator [Lysobacter sp. MMG2]MBU8978054.1 MarR family transcriptional regulator [Lysobacter sp. MMG2]